MLQDLIMRKNMNIRQLSLKSGVGYNYVYKLVNNQADIGNCSITTAKKLATALGITLDEFYVEVEESFLHFRSTLHHKMNENEDTTILYILDNNLITYNIEKGNYIKGLYLLATLDFLCNKNQYDLVSDYDKYRNLTLKTPFYATSIAAKKADKNQVHYISEYERYNIYEEDLYDAC